jgi:acetyl-CoA carboxylase biotin carboxyl carrier protein
VSDGEDRVVVAVSGAAEGPWEVLSPGVGWWSAAPRSGELLGPGSRVGVLTQLHRRTVLCLPDSHVGRVEGTPRARKVAVAYGQQLFRLAPIEASGALAAAGAGAERGADDVPEGCWAVVAPTDGVFYRGPDPSSPPFVECGDRIRLGQPIGLVEVMKTFNQIAYGGPGYPQEVEVVEVRRGDAEEVDAGDVLVVVR